MLRRAALLIAVILTTLPALGQEMRLIRLAGTPEQIGTAWGELNKDIIVHDMEADYLKRAEAAGISRETLLERAETYVRIVEKIAPHWLVEARATARAAGVPEDLYIAYRDGAVRDRFLHECTSYAVSRDAARNGAILFHKTRDNRDRQQATFIIDSSLEGINKFIAVSDVNTIDCSMMVNEKGLAGAADYPVESTRRDDPNALRPEPAEPNWRAPMCGLIFRHIAERASNCAEALAILEDLVAKGYYGGGAVNGNHWLFVDRDGVILEASNNSRHVASKFHAQPVYFSRLDNSAAARRLRDATDPIDFHLFHNVSRDPSICFGSSISGMTVEIDPNHPEMLTCAWIALPVRSVAFPVFMGQGGAPACLVDGTAYRLGKASPRQTPRWEALEQSLHPDKERLKGEIASSIAAGNPRDAHVEALERWSAAEAEKLVEALRILR